MGAYCSQCRARAVHRIRRWTQVKQTCIGRVYSNMCIDMEIDMHIDMCIDMEMDMCINMCLDMCIDMCIEMEINLCTDLPRHVQDMKIDM